MSNIKNLRPNKRGPYKQDYYNPKNIEKYIGDPTLIIYRSSWEYKFMVYCDISSHVLEWSSEPIAIDYISPLDKKKHKYHIDFYAKMKVKDEVKKYLIEVKPIYQYKVKPVFEGRKTKKKIERYKKDMETWIINNAKFKYAKKFAENNGMEFIVIDESNLKTT